MTSTLLQKNTMKKLFRKKESILRRIEECSDFLRGSITSVCSTCNRATCICSGNPKGKAHRLTYKDADRKSRIVYIPCTHLPNVRKLLANYAKRQELNKQLFEVNMEIFKKQFKSEREQQ